MYAGTRAHALPVRGGGRGRMCTFLHLQVLIVAFPSVFLFVLLPPLTCISLSYYCFSFFRLCLPSVLRFTYKLYFFHFRYRTSSPPTPPLSFTTSFTMSTFALERRIIAWATGGHVGTRNCPSFSEHVL